MGDDTALARATPRPPHALQGSRRGGFLFSSAIVEASVPSRCRRRFSPRAEGVASSKPSPRHAQQNTQSIPRQAGGLKIRANFNEAPSSYRQFCILAFEHIRIEGDVLVIIRSPTCVEMTVQQESAVYAKLSGQFVYAEAEAGDDNEETFDAHTRGVEIRF